MTSYPFLRPTVSVLLLAAAISGCSSSDTTPDKPAETVTVTASPTTEPEDTAATTPDAASEETTEAAPAPTFVARFQDVADYVVAQGLPFAVGGREVDQAIATVCASVDGQPVSPQWRQQAVTGLGMGDMGERYFDALVEGCYQTGNAERYVRPKPKPKPKPTPRAVTVPGDGTFEVGVDIPAGTYRNPGAKGPGYFCVAYAAAKPNDLTTYLRGSTSKGPAIVTVNPGEFFTTQFCKPFTKAP